MYLPEIQMHSSNVNLSEIKLNLQNIHYASSSICSIDHHFKDFLFNLVMKSEKKELYTKQIVDISQSPIVQQLKKIGEALLEQDLDIYSAEFACNPVYSSWHFDACDKPTIIMTFPITTLGTEYIPPSQNYGQIMPFDDFSSLPQLDPNTISIFRGGNEDSTNPIYKSIPPLLHRTPPNQDARIILLVRFSL